MPAVCDSPTIRWWQYLILEPPQTKCICQQKRECKSFNRHHGHCTREEEEYQNKTRLSKKISIGMLRVCGVKLTDSTALQTFPLECVASWSRTGLEHLSEKEGKKHTTSIRGWEQNTTKAGAPSTVWTGDFVQVKMLCTWREGGRGSRTLCIIRSHKKVNVVQQEVRILRKCLQSELVNSPAGLFVLVDKLLQLGYPRTQ